MANSGFSKKGKKDYGAQDNFERKAAKRGAKSKFKGGAVKDDKYVRSNARTDKFLRDEDQDDSGDRRKPNLNQTPTSSVRKFPRQESQGGKTEALVPIRLNKYIANSGICSRREADDYIKSGLVKINGQVVKDMGVKVELSDEVSFNGKVISPERKVYVLLNKPKDFVTTLSDPHAERTVMELVKNACQERIYPVGRLDKNTTGLLLFTNDGELTKRIVFVSRR